MSNQSQPESDRTPAGPLPQDIQVLTNTMTPATKAMTAPIQKATLLVLAAATGGAA